ncbi:MAG: M20 family metallopeptidase [Anaerovoracaceae bacterium]
MIEKFDKIVSENLKVFKNISTYLYENPELGGDEFKSSSCLRDVLSSEGFCVRVPYETLPTAFVAEYGKGDITVAFLAEYDALPGYGENGEPGHACGHNWIGATMCGCGIALSKISNELNCKIKVIGTPAEETFGAKVEMAELGAFDDVDFVFQAHLDEASSMEVVALALNSIEFTFEGKAAHAAAYPEKGINALDGVIALFNGINAYREMTRDDARIHGIITNGGVAANIIPELATCQISFRAKDREYVRELRERIIEIAQGAALISNTKLRFFDYENKFDNLVNVPLLVEFMADKFEAAGIKNLVPNEEYPGAGSTDIGNVSYLCPTLYVEVDLEGDEPFSIHDVRAYEMADSEAAHLKMEQVILAFGHGVIELIKDQELINRIKAEHKEIVK